MPLCPRFNPRKNGRRDNRAEDNLDVMESMATEQEAAFEMLYRWIQRQGEVLSMNSSAECSELMIYAFSSLELRPVLFKYSLDEFCVARRKFVISSFLNALTKGTTEKFTPEALTMITEGLCKPLKVRVEQVIGGEHGPVVLYKLSNLFRFYYITMRPSLLGNAPLLDTINDLCNTLCRLFRTSLSMTTNKLLEKVETPSMDLIPVQGIHHVLLMLKEVLEAHDIVLLPNTDKKDSFEKIFSIVIDALLNTLALTSTDLDVVNLAVYMLNCLHLIISVISLFEYTEKRLEMLQAQPARSAGKFLEFPILKRIKMHFTVDVQVEVLAGEQVGYILHKCGISDVYQSFSQHRPSHGPASKINGLDKDTVSSSLKSFESFLTSPEKFKLSQCSLISSIKLRDNVDHSSMEILLAAYKCDSVWL
uniref:Conserved oligomeric Golgi complex subunit 6 n=1 Tax=Romanomermis culicivorax TaxID=13658 RepID=A0A915K4A7_ROMCU